MYFDYLRGGPAEPLAGVFRHNQMDLRGLAALAGKILTLLDSGNGIANAAHPSTHDPLDVSTACPALCNGAAIPLARANFMRPRCTRVFRILSSGSRSANWLSLQSGNWITLARHHSGKNCAKLRKRLSATMSAILAEDAQRALEAAIEAAEQLAIYYEHRAKQPRRAAELIRTQSPSCGTRNAPAGSNRRARTRSKRGSPAGSSRLERRCAIRTTPDLLPSGNVK